MKEQDGIDLINKVISGENLRKSYEKVRQIQGDLAYRRNSDLKGHMYKYYQPLKRKLIDGSYEPQSVKRKPGIFKSKENSGYTGFVIITMLQGFLIYFQQNILV